MNQNQSIAIKLRIMFCTDLNLRIKTFERLKFEVFFSTLFILKQIFNQNFICDLACLMFIVQNSLI